MTHSFLDNEMLHQSDVVANCLMNRERQLSGTNGYSFELRFDVLDWLVNRRKKGQIRWLDVCCGTGLALLEAVEEFQKHLNAELLIDGIDLVGHFISHSYSPQLQLHKISLEDWAPVNEYDLVTCVHGLHYLGDKLEAIRRMANCLSPQGLFVANVDLSNFRFPDGRSAGKTVVKRMRDQRLTYDSRYRLVKCDGVRSIDSFGLKYIGADDNAGPNYTGQAAVNSHYEN